MESRFDADFSHVQVHTDQRAAESADAVNALAYTVGRHVVFGTDGYSPTSHQGRGLLAHELAHTIQQRDPGGAPPSANPRGMAESSAAAAGREVANGGAVSGELPACGVGLSRAPVPPASDRPFSGDRRMRTWRRYARSEARKDAARIRKSGRLSPEDRQEVNAKLEFFEGAAKEIYIQEIKPALVEADEAERREREARLAALRQRQLDRKAADARREELFRAKYSDEALEKKIGKIREEMFEKRFDVDSLARVMPVYKRFEGERTRRRDLRRARPVTGPETVAQAVSMLEEAWRDAEKEDPPDVRRALALVAHIDDWLKQVASSDKYGKYFKNGMFRTNAMWIVGSTKGQIDNIRFKLQIQGEDDWNRKTHLGGHWELGINSLKLAREYLEVMGAKKTIKETSLHGLQETTTRVLKYEAAGYAAAVVAPLVIGAAVEAAPLITTEAATGTLFRAAPRVMGWAARHPILAAEIGTASVATGLQVGEDKYLDPVQLAFNLLHIRYAAGGSKPRSPNPSEVEPPNRLVRPPTTPVTRPVVGPEPVKPASPIPPVRRFNVTGRDAFDVPLVKPPAPARPATAPVATRPTIEPQAPVRPARPAAPVPPTPAPSTPAPPTVPPRSVTPPAPTFGDRLRRWRFGARLKLTIDGVDLANLGPDFGPGGARRPAGPTPAAVVDTSPRIAPPTPTPPSAVARAAGATQGNAQGPAPSVGSTSAAPASTSTSAVRRQSPSLTVTPDAGATATVPGGPTSTGTTVSTAAPSTGGSVGAAGPGVSAARINPTAVEPTARLSTPDSGPADQATTRAPALSQETRQQAVQQLAAALVPLAQQPTGGMIGFIDVAGVQFHDLQVIWAGRELRVGYFGIERVAAPAGAGAEIQDALEQAVAQVARQVGAPSARVFARTVVNDRWRAILLARGYQALLLKHARGYEAVLASRVLMSQPTAANPAAPAAVLPTTPSPATPTPGGPASPGLPPSGSSPSGSSPSSSSPSGSSPSGVSPSVTPTSKQATPVGAVPSSEQSTQQRASAYRAPVSAFTSPVQTEVIDARDYNIIRELTVGANLGKLVLEDKVTGEWSLFKPAWGERDILGSNVGIMPGDRFRRAPAAAYLAREAGFVTPGARMVIWRRDGKDEIGSLQEWTKEGRVAGTIPSRRQQRRARTSQPKLDLDAFDYVIANMDRNDWNWRVVFDSAARVVQRVIPIDMDAAMPPGGQRYPLNRPDPPYQEPLPATISRTLYARLLLMRGNRARIERDLREFLEQPEIDGIFTRLDEVLNAVSTGRISLL